MLETLAAPLIIVHVFSCLFMTGLIWLVQLVHYPSFAFVDKGNFADFHQFHSKRITWIVAPAMGLELLTAALLCLSGNQILIWNFISVLSLWGLTGLISVPLHNRLSKKAEAGDIRKLIRTNWLRTGLWTARSVLMVVLAFLAPALFGKSVFQ